MKECHLELPIDYKGSQSITRTSYELWASMGMWWFEKTEVYGDNTVIEQRNPLQNLHGFP